MSNKSFRIQMRERERDRQTEKKITKNGFAIIATSHLYFPIAGLSHVWSLKHFQRRQRRVSDIAETQKWLQKITAKWNARPYNCMENHYHRW